MPSSCSYSITARERHLLIGLIKSWKANSEAGESRQDFQGEAGTGEESRCTGDASRTLRKSDIQDGGGKKSRG